MVQIYCLKCKKYTEKKVQMFYVNLVIEQGFLLIVLKVLVKKKTILLNNNKQQVYSTL